MSQAIGIDAPGLQFGMLGTLQVTRSGQPLPLGGRQQRAVLASLLVEADTVVSLRRLADALWGEHTPPSAVITVQTYISRLREILEPERVRGAPATVLITEPGGYRLRLDGAGLDAATFEQRVRAGRAALEAGRNAEAASELDEAVGLWRGPVLADLTDFDFVREAADRLDELRLGALEARADAELALGRHRELLTDLDQLISAHPLRERFRAQQMLALYRCGRQSEALASYQQMRTTLADELGIDPSPPLQQLHQAILRQDPELDWQPAAIEPARAAVVDQAGHAGIHRPRRRRWLIPGIAAGIAALLVTGTWVAVRHLSSGRTLSALPPNSVGRLDRHGVLRAGVTVAPTPNGLAYGAGSLWATSTADGSVSRIDPRTQNVIETIPVGAEPNAIAVAGNDVWVANGGDGSVSRINAQNNRVVDTVTGLGDGPDAIAAGAGGIWVALASDDAVRRIDPRTDRPGPAILVGGQPDGIGIGRDTVWVADGADGTVSRIDATTGQANSPIFVGAGPKGIAVTPTAVWITNSLDLTVSRIDPATGTVNLTTPVGDGPHSVVAGPNAVWVSDEYDGTIIKIDPDTGRAIARIQTGSSPCGLAMVGADVWVASGALANRAHRGGTLTIETTPDALPGAATGIDPAAVFDHASFWLQHLMYDGLVGLRRASGADGLTLVPDLATALPRPTDGGRTYTFTLRSGIRYSTGELVRPADIARGVRRALAPTATSSSYFTDIVGAQQCIDHPASCDLSHGVVTDRTTVIFHLTAPDPDFLYKLTNFVWATAPHTPIGLARTPLPATGPYMIFGYTAKEKQFTLIRNRQFRQWSFAAQPDGYPSVIRWRSVSNGDTQIADVLADRADLLDFRFSGIPSKLIDDLARRFPTRLHRSSSLDDTYEFLNTRLAPFNDIRVRKALNYAVDRHKLVVLSGGDTQARPSCQIDPPNFPGYRPYCPYTVDPRLDGRYTGPDMQRARRLIAASGTAGMPVTVWSVDYTYVPAVSQYYVTLLRTLGYRVRLHKAPGCCYFAQVGDARNRAQIGWGLWGPDFPAASNFYDPLVSCGSTNLSNYCSKKVEAIAIRARASELTDPGAARQQWAEMDRVATNDAPLISETSAVQSELTSSRVGNEQDNPLLGPLLDQMWVR